jgi:hypothetical protein
MAGGRQSADTAANPRVRSFRTGRSHRELHISVVRPGYHTELNGGGGGCGGS